MTARKSKTTNFITSFFNRLFQSKWDRRIKQLQQYTMEICKSGLDEVVMYFNHKLEIIAKELSETQKELRSLKENYEKINKIFSR
jgi:uncharacterized protein YutD